MILGNTDGRQVLGVFQDTRSHQWDCEALTKGAQYSKPWPQSSKHRFVKAATRSNNNLLQHSELRLTPRRCAVNRLSRVMDVNSGTLHAARRMLHTEDSRLSITCTETFGI